jgi:23S rRNA pseudouridine1911/1915/1917 synthase
MRQWTVPVRLDGIRLDQALSELSPGMSRRRARVLVEQGSVYLDGRRVRVLSRPVAAGASLRVATEEVVREAGGDAEVLWEGPGALVLNKPAGVPLVPTRLASSGCLLAALAKGRGVPVSSLHPVHRLDAPVSGAVLVALTREAAGFLGGVLQAGAIRKTYVAWVMGVPQPQEGVWSWPLSRGTGGLVTVTGSGRSAETQYRVLERRADRVLLELVPVTGRTHQLRVHCAHSGHPILGDRKYGRGAMTSRRLLLHGLRLSFPRPDGEGTVTVEAPLPDDFTTGGVK